METIHQTASNEEKLKQKHKPDVMFRIYSPSSTVPLLMSESLGSTVEESAAKAQAHFGLEGNYVLQDENDRILTNKDSLKESGVKCGEDFFLTRNGGGVAAPSLSEVDAEIEALLFFCKRRGVDCEVSYEEKLIKCSVVRKSDGQLFYFAFNIEDYNKYPPKIFFSDENFKRANIKNDYPAPTQTQFGSSIFHGTPTICAHFNRLAYAVHAGPHADWDMQNWKAAGKPNEVTAVSLSEMLSIILRDLQLSTGKMQ